MAGTKIWDYCPGYEFDKEADLKVVPSWFWNATQSVPPWTPMFAWFWMQYCAYGTRVGAEQLSIPTSKGWEKRVLEGCDYSAILVVRDEEEIKRREAKFREAMRPFIEDFDAWWKPTIDEMLGHYERLKKFDLDAADNVQLFAHLEDVIWVCRRMWEVHFVGMYAAYNAFITFEGLCKDLLGIDDTSPEFHKLMAGFDNRVFQNDRALWQFGQDALKTGLADIFMTSEPKDVVPKLEQTKAGREWLKKFRDWLWDNGWRISRMAEINEPSWVEDPTPAIFAIKGYLAKGGSFILDEVRERLAKEREKTTKQLIQRVPEEQRDWFLALLKLAQKSQTYSEEHDHYLDLYTHALIRRCCLGIGRRLVQAGTIDQPDDTFYLMPDEIKRVLPCPEYHDLRHIANRRRKEWQKWQTKTDYPVVITTRSGIEEAVVKDLLPSMDAIVLKVIVGALPKVRPELKADLYGTCGAPGVAEGPARVIMSFEQLVDVRPGDILVAPTTCPSWTPVFALISGAVIDRGGSLSHPSIVGREFGIPVVINVFEGTTKIKTGQRIRIDANQGTVHILR
jgi:phosphohistidine swiveling domain-containing protein